MLFGNASNHQAIDIPFNWNADYVNGNNVSEYDFGTHKKNDFYMIDRAKVIRFGLFGQNMKFFFEMYDGSFNLRGRRIEMEYHLSDGSGKIIRLTTNFEKKDIITYKEAYADLDPKRQGVQKSSLKSINFGYKTKIENEDIVVVNNDTPSYLKLFFQPIVSLPYNESALIEIKLTSNIDVEGYLIIKSRGVEIERFYAPLKSNIAGQLNWTIK